MKRTATAISTKKPARAERKVAVERPHKKTAKTNRRLRRAERLSAKEPIVVSAPSQDAVENQPDLHTLDLIGLRNAVEKAKEDAPAGSDWSAKYDLGKRVLVNSFDPPEQDDHDLELLAVFQRIARENVSNYATPVNDLICDLVAQHGIRPLTLKDVADKFQEFETFWHESFETAHKLYREYRPLVAVGLDAEPERLSS